MAAMTPSVPQMHPTPLSLIFAMQLLQMKLAAEDLSQKLMGYIEATQLRTTRLEQQSLKTQLGRPRAIESLEMQQRTQLMVAGAMTPCPVEPATTLTSLIAPLMTSSKKAQKEQT